MGARIDPDKQAKIVFADTGPIDLAWDPLQFSRGLVSHGDVSIFGSTVTSYEPLAIGAKAKDKALTLAATPVGWKAGDRLILTGESATNSSGVNHDEEVQIVSVGVTSDGHTVVTITDPKTFTRPVAINFVEALLPDTDVFEHICNENEKDARHLVGK
jgi:hypothetical protein